MPLPEFPTKPPPAPELDPGGPAVPPLEDPPGDPDPCTAGLETSPPADPSVEVITAGDVVDVTRTVVDEVTMFCFAVEDGSEVVEGA